MRAAVCVGTVAWLVVACGGGGTAADPKSGAAAAVDPATAKKLAQGVAALRQAPADVRAELAAAALAEAESGRLPTELIAAFEELPRVPTSARELVAMKAIASPAMLEPLEELCAGDGASTMAGLATASPTDRGALLWDACNFERVGLVTREQARGASFGALVLAHLAHRLLATKGGPSEDEITLLRASILGAG